MKRSLSILIAAILLFAVAALPALASGTTRFYLTGPSTASTGDTITVKFCLEGEYSAHILNAKINYDNTSLKVLSFEHGGALNEMSSGFGNLITCEELPALDGITLGMLRISAPTSAQGELIIINFQVLGTAASSTEIAVIVSEFEYAPIGGDISAIGFTTENLTVNITNGTGTGATPIPGPTSTAATPDPKTSTPSPIEPIVTAEPTDNGGKTLPTEGAKTTDAPSDPNATNAPVTDPDTGKVTDRTPAPSATDEPSVAGLPKKTLIILGAALGAVVLVLVVVVVLVAVRSSKDKKNKNR